ncbi:MAG: guanylate kinase, partial [Verrucomicrobia bacterium]|nr:guanylate kinase [Verrucomicrobiota bacterium]
AAGDFLEHALVYQHRYGTLKSEVRNRLRDGMDVILTVDVQGAKALQEAASDDADLRAALVTVFLTPQTMTELEARLRRRNQNSPSDLERRLAEARIEIQRWHEFQYLIISTTIPEDLRRMLAIVDAAKMRSSRCRAPEL